MLPDTEGFLHPSVDAKKCIGCGKCAAICPVLPENKSEPLSGEPDCYAAWSRDEEIRFNSTSGGVFTHLAEAVLDMGGAVAGAKYREDNLVEHAVIHSKSEIELLRQSKYVQSEMGMVFRQIKSELTDGKPILFAGTPCQCAGLRAYLGHDDPNLYLCDFICLGVNSPKVYAAYLHELENKFGTRVKRVWFKNKTFGWKKFSTRIDFENGYKYIADRDEDTFMLGYVKPQATLYMRSSCYQCKFKGISRPTDITLADFWGVEKIFPDINIDHGVSAVMVHSERGRELFEKLKGLICFYPCASAQILKSNPRMTSSVTLPEESKSFWQYFEENQKFSEIINKLK